jgi:hypothetical protein
VLSLLAASLPLLVAIFCLDATVLRKARTHAPSGPSSSPLADRGATARTRSPHIQGRQRSRVAQPAVPHGQGQRDGPLLNACVVRSGANPHRHGGAKRRSRPGAPTVSAAPPRPRASTSVLLPIPQPLASVLLPNCDFDERCPHLGRRGMAGSTPPLPVASGTHPLTLHLPPHMCNISFFFATLFACCKLRVPLFWKLQGES